LLVNVATELAVFLRADAWGGGDVELSLSLLEEFRDSQENGLVSFLAGGAGAGCGRGEATVLSNGPGLFDGDSAEGDQGIVGRAFVMLLNDRVFPAGSFSDGLRRATRF
jgi:hypothetical protein